LKQDKNIVWWRVLKIIRWKETGEINCCRIQDKQMEIMWTI
jgi:hypothetical protein